MRYNDFGSFNCATVLIPSLPGRLISINTTSALIYLNDSINSSAFGNAATQFISSEDETISSSDCLISASSSIITTLFVSIDAFMPFIPKHSL